MEAGAVGENRFSLFLKKMPELLKLFAEAWFGVDIGVSECLARLLHNKYTYYHL